MTEPELRALAAQPTNTAEDEGYRQQIAAGIALDPVQAEAVFASLDAEREKVKVLREALVGIRSWMPPSGSDPELDEAMRRADHALATTEPKPERKADE